MTDTTENLFLQYAAEQDGHDLVVVRKVDAEEFIAVVREQATEIKRLNLLIYQQVNRIDRAERSVKDAIADIEEATRTIMILREKTPNTLSSRAEALLARMEGAELND